MEAPISPEFAAEDRGPAFWITSVVLYSLSSAFIFTRWYTRYFINKRLGLDDYLIAPALVFNTVSIVMLKAQYDNGVGKHTIVLDPQILSNAFKYTWITQIFYYATIACVRMSILALYQRISPNKTYQLFVKSAFVLVTCQGLASILTTCSFCRPISRIWNIKTFPMGCINLTAFNYFNAIFGVCIDVISFCLPIPVLSRLQIPTRKKIAICAIFGVGLIACAGTISRLATSITWINSTDLAWTFAPINICTAIEVNVAIMASSLPSLKPFFKNVISSSTPGNSNYELKDRSDGINSKGSRQAGNSSNADTERGLGGGYSINVLGGGRSGNGKGVQTITAATANESEENIIPKNCSDRTMATTVGDDGIVRTVEYQAESVEYQVEYE